MFTLCAIAMTKFLPLVLLLLTNTEIPDLPVFFPTKDHHSKKSNEEIKIQHVHNVCSEQDALSHSKALQIGIFSF